MFIRSVTSGACASIQPPIPAAPSPYATAPPAREPAVAAPASKRNRDGAAAASSATGTSGTIGHTSASATPQPNTNHPALDVRAKAPARSNHERRGAGRSSRAAARRRDTLRDKRSATAPAGTAGVARIGSPNTIETGVRRGRRAFFGSTSRVPAMPTGTTVAPRRASTPTPDLKGRIRPSEERVPSGNSNTFHPSARSCSARSRPALPLRGNGNAPMPSDASAPRTRPRKK
jgi:hypothetical protein